jgi:callose synthase
MTELNFFRICTILYLTNCYFFDSQKDNVRNQREHLILLLANSHIRLYPKPEPLNKVLSCLLHRHAFGKTVILVIRIACYILTYSYIPLFFPTIAA